MPIYQLTPERLEAERKRDRAAAQRWNRQILREREAEERLLAHYHENPSSGWDDYVGIGILIGAVWFYWHFWTSVG